MLGKAEISLMLDYYGSFLTERQAALMRMSADEDMSLSEIAEQVGISRQAVRDHLAKASRELASLEERLGLAARDRELLRCADRLEAALADPSGEGLRRSAGEVCRVIRSLVK
ncbi:MAG: helix-turn-helix domain-containing protein [Clostridia bacterium]|nr:helix-turn-helix domain-containing protein [Clostridia bacterium]